MRLRLRVITLAASYCPKQVPTLARFKSRGNRLFLMVGATKSHGKDMDIGRAITEASVQIVCHSLFAGHVLGTEGNRTKTMWFCFRRFHRWLKI